MPDLIKTASSAGGDITIHEINVTIPGGAVDNAIIEKIRIATKRAVLESSVEIRRVLDNRTRDREQMI